MSIDQKGLTSHTIVNIDVPALAPAITFYTAALGLRLTRILDDDVAELTGGSSVIYLMAKPTGSARPRPLSRRAAATRATGPRCTSIS